MRALTRILFLPLAILWGIDQWAKEPAPNSVQRFLESLQRADFEAGAKCLSESYREVYSTALLKASWEMLTQKIAPATGFVLSPPSKNSSVEQRARLRFGVRSIESLFVLDAEGKISCWIVDTRLATNLDAMAPGSSELAEHLRETYLDLKGGRLHLRYPIPQKPLAKLLLLRSVHGERVSEASANSFGMSNPAVGEEAWSQALTLAGLSAAVLDMPTPSGAGGSAVGYSPASLETLSDAVGKLTHSVEQIGVDLGEGPLFMIVFGEVAPQLALALQSLKIHGSVLVCPPLPSVPIETTGLRYLVVLGTTVGSGDASQELDAWNAALAGSPGSRAKQYAGIALSSEGVSIPSRVFIEDLLKWSRDEPLGPSGSDFELGQGVYGIPLPEPFRPTRAKFIVDCEKHYPAPGARPWGKEASYSPDSLYIPKDLEECFEELSNLLPKDELAAFKRGNEEEACTGVHMGLGMWMRNNWGLWGGSRLGFYFAEIGIFHPDDMSGIILTSFHRHLNGKAIKLDKQVKYYEKYWKKAQKDKAPSALDGKSGVKLLNH